MGQRHNRHPRYRMEKLKQIKKKMIKESAIAGAVIAILGAVFFFIDMQLEETTMELSTLQSELQEIGRSTSDLERKYQIVSTSLVKFNELNSQMKNGDFTINGKDAIETFRVLDEKYRTMNLNLNIPQNADIVSDEAAPRKAIDIKKMPLTLDFFAYSDVHALSLIDEMIRSLNGFLKFNEFSLTRQTQVSMELLAELSRGGKSNVIATSMKLDWLGMDKKPSPDLQQPAQ